MGGYSAPQPLESLSVCLTCFGCISSIVDGMILLVIEVAVVSALVFRRKSRCGSFSLFRSSFGARSVWNTGCFTMKIVLRCPNDHSIFRAGGLCINWPTVSRCSVGRSVVCVLTTLFHTFFCTVSEPGTAVPGMQQQHLMLYYIPRKYAVFQLEARQDAHKNDTFRLHPAWIK